MRNRILFDICLFALVVFTPWWVSFSIALLATLIFNRYIEYIVVGLILDSLYGAPLSKFNNFSLILTLSAGISFIIIEYIKTIIRFER